MKFVPETIDFIQNDVLPLLCLGIDLDEDHQLMPTDNQKNLI